MASARETRCAHCWQSARPSTRSNEKIGYICNFLVLAACIVSAANAMIRYAFGYSSNGWLERSGNMFAILVMFGASYTFKRNEHVRVEIFYLFLPSVANSGSTDRHAVLPDSVLFAAQLSVLAILHASLLVGEISGNAAA